MFVSIKQLPSSELEKKKKSINMFMFIYNERIMNELSPRACWEHDS